MGLEVNCARKRLSVVGSGKFADLYSVSIKQYQCVGKRQRDDDPTYAGINETAGHIGTVMPRCTCTRKRAVSANGPARRRSRATLVRRQQRR